jgi:hypothetical protein
MRTVLSRPLQLRHDFLEKIDLSLIVYLHDVCRHASALRSRHVLLETVKRKAGSISLAIIGAVMNHPREWFQPKVVGIGWSPRTWEGWAIIVSVIAVGAVVGRVNL